MRTKVETNSREIAYERIMDLRSKYGDSAQNISDANEAKTRVVIIDKILEALGWEPSDFNPESPTGTGYIDYLLSVDNIPRIVIEAKKIGHTFRSPKSQMHEIAYSLSYFRRTYSRALTGVLEQAVTYAHEKEIQFAVLTNGAEWLLIQVIPPPSQKIENLRGFYFGNLLSDNSNFDLFWELLSKPAVIRGALEENLAQLNISPARETLTVSSEFGDLCWKRPESTLFLRDFYNRFFAEITNPDRRKMLEKCFIADARLDQYQRELKSALQDTVPSFLPSDTQDITPEEGEKLLLEEAGEQTGRVILVTGSVGCGKSTLVTKVQFEARQQKENNLIVLKIDLIDEVTDESNDIISTLWQYIAEEWERIQPKSYHHENLKKYFGKELKALRHGEYAEIFKIDENEYFRQEAQKLSELRNDPRSFFSKCWQYYRQKHYGIVLIIDNVDRALEAYQKKVYAFAHKFARMTGATIIITMREFTFYRGQEGGFLDVRSQDTIFHLQTPNLEQLLAKRIRYVQEYVQEDSRVSQWKRSNNWEGFKTAAHKHAEMLKKTFLLSSSGRDVLRLLASISWHDVRYFLDTLRRLHFQLGTNGEPWNETEVIAALMTSSDTGRISPVLSNIYRPPFPNYQCYYLKLRVLLMLIYGVKSGELRKGIPFQRLFTFTRLYGYQERWTRSAIEELVKERFLECLETPSTSDYIKNYKLSELHTFRASPLAVILVKHIVAHPIYLCFIGNELPFHKSTTFERYRNSLKSLLETLDNYQFERVAVDLIIDTELGKLVASYLYQAFFEEQPSRNLKNLPEISATERMLNQIITQLKEYAHVSTPPQLTQWGTEIQPSLFKETYEPSQISVVDTIPIPQDITKIRIGRSEQAPLIFWALVALKARGKSLSSGVEITDVINTYLVDDYNKKFPNNISRALRSPILQSQAWLMTNTTSHPRHKRFGLAEDWQKYWKEIFKEPAPNI